MKAAQWLRAALFFVAAIPALLMLALGDWLDPVDARYDDRNDY